MTDKSIEAKIRDGQISDRERLSDHPPQRKAFSRRHRPLFNEVDEDLLKNPKAKRCYY